MKRPTAEHHKEVSELLNQSQINSRGNTQPIKFLTFISNHIHQTTANQEQPQSLLASFGAKISKINRQYLLEILGTNPTFTKNTKQSTQHLFHI